MEYIVEVWGTESYMAFIKIEAENEDTAKELARDKILSLEPIDWEETDFDFSIAGCKEECAL